IGMILAIRMVVQSGLWSPQSLVIMLMAAEIGAVTVGLGVDFYRYYLPVLLVICILIGVAVGEAARVAWNFVQRPAMTVPESSVLVTDPVQP
ncbi:MAG TPA: hypothetical protein VEW66_05840, partial [Thermomicrobiales bacterium]|nr:hypothetical protein [Thermomicrobiales bacterium]